MFFQMGSRNTNKGDTEWDLIQVLEAGMAMPEEEDEVLFSLSVTRLGTSILSNRVGLGVYAAYLWKPALSQQRTH